MFIELKKKQTEVSVKKTEKKIFLCWSKINSHKNWIMKNEDRNQTKCIISKTGH